MVFIGKQIFFYLVVIFILKSDANGHSLVAKELPRGDNLESKYFL